MKATLENHESWRQLTSSELKKLQIEVLKKFAQVCEKENLQFMLYYGSLLGAVRHKGMIPWDDDIDLCMMRESYDRLVNINWSTKNLKLISSVNHPDAPYPFTKISNTGTLFLENQNYPVDDLGVNIDVFPLDYIPENPIRRGAEEFILKILKIILAAKVVKVSPERSTLKNVILKTANLLFFLPSQRAIANTINSIASQARCPSAMIGCRVGPYGVKKDCFPEQHFRYVESIPFEDGVMPVPVSHDFVLTKLYGDYMTPPPDQSRNSHHDFKAYIKCDNAGGRH